MSSKLENHAKNVGDIDVYYNDDFVQVTVDGETAIMMPRLVDNGLLELSLTLTQLVKVKGK